MLFLAKSVNDNLPKFGIDIAKNTQVVKNLTTIIGNQWYGVFAP